MKKETVSRERNIIVLGAGYAGAAAVKELEKNVGGGEVTWISENPYHLVQHQVHRVVRNRDAENDVVVPVGDIKTPETEFVEATVEDVEVEDKHVITDRGVFEYEVLLVCLGGKTAFYGIPGLERYSHTLKSLDDALGLREAMVSAARESTTEEPAKVVVGGAGLTGIETAGEIAEYREASNEPVEVKLLEADESIYPPGGEDVRELLVKLLDSKDIETSTGDPISEVDAESVYLDSGSEVDYDVLVWTGGVRGNPTSDQIDVDTHHDRIVARNDFTTSAEDVFVVGDAGKISLNGGYAPMKGSAAWKGGEVAARNLVSALEGEQLENWRYVDEGTVISVGDECVADEIRKSPVSTFSGYPANHLKKYIAMRWIAHLTDWRRAWGSRDAM
ncbi:MAG: NAD(P)/FAD-dependent oxidoreductase [Halobacteria archaeon]